MNYTTDAPSALIIFIKNPVLGKVKTRLAATVGKRKALDIYQQLLFHTHAITRQLSCQKHLFYSHFIPTQPDNWENDRYQKQLQTPTPNLGKRMADAFEQVLKNATKVIIIGSDCNQLSTNIIEQAFLQLDTHDVVVGPATDGGYYLLGMKKKHHLFFANKQWSTATVCADTLNDCQKLALSCYLLPTLSDVDTYQDWQNICKN